MACIEVPKIALPTLGLGLSIGITLPALSLDPKFCCKLPLPAIATPPIPLGLNLVPAAVTTAINVYIAAVNTYVNALQFKCPKE